MTGVTNLPGLTASPGRLADALAGKARLEKLPVALLIPAENRRVAHVCGGVSEDGISSPAKAVSRRFQRITLPTTTYISPARFTGGNRAKMSRF